MLNHVCEAAVHTALLCAPCKEAESGGGIYLGAGDSKGCLEELRPKRQPGEADRRAFPAEETACAGPAGRKEGLIWGTAGCMEWLVGLERQAGHGCPLPCSRGV